MKKIILTLILLFWVNTSSAEFIVNESANVTQLSRAEVIKIFLFYRKFWGNSGAKITVILPPPNSLLFKKLATEELNVGAISYYESIKARTFAGAADPVFVDSEAEVLIKVSNTPYSIGYYHDHFKINTGYGITTVSIQ